MKYQIILETPEILDDQSFEELMKLRLEACIPEYNVVEARSLEGIREEVWKRKEEFKDSLPLISHEKVDEVFDDLNDLFKIT